MFVAVLNMAVEGTTLGRQRANLAINKDTARTAFGSAFEWQFGAIDWANEKTVETLGTSAYCQVGS